MDELLSSPALKYITASVVFGWMFTWVARWIAPRLNLIDRPDGGRKRHLHPTPLMGGVAIFVAFAGAIGLWFSAEPIAAEMSPVKMRWLACMMVSSALMCLVGVWDDRWPLRPRAKFLLQFCAIIPFLAVSRDIHVIQVASLRCEVGALGGLFAAFWVLSCVNVINLIDGLDGLAGTIGMIVMLTVGATATMSDQNVTAMVAFLVAGSCLGFLFHNWPPAKIFLGDAGSMMIGFLAGALSIEASTKSAACFTLAVPLAVLSVPFFDTTMAILRRKLTGRSIGEADRHHFHHRLQDQGLSRPQALMVIGGVALTMAAAALVSVATRSDWPAIVTLVAVFTLLMAARVFGDHEAALVFRFLHAIYAVFTEASRSLQERLVSHRDQDAAASPVMDQLWQSILNHSDATGLQSLHLVVSDQSGMQRRVLRQWVQQADEDATDQTWTITCGAALPVRGRVRVEASGIFCDAAATRSVERLIELLHATCLSAQLNSGDMSPATIGIHASPDMDDDSRRAA